jgi:demethylmenaquinone methyltransferase / 2-methoxy-6-polyprenyl-1,4-benzoquinol methylase
MTKKKTGSINSKSRSGYLHNIFTAVPSHYDIINHLMTFGMDILWRKKAAQECVSFQPHSVLDICCGTGDLALTVAELAGNKTSITGLDFSKPMLEKAAIKVKKAGYKISFVPGDIADIPFPENTFNCLCIGFGFRNLTYKNNKAAQHISEIIRVLKPGGRFVIVESSQPDSGARIIKFLHRLYVKYFVFLLGLLISGNSKAYKYLAYSVLNYYNADELCNLLLNAGFRKVTYKHLFFGAAAIHVAVK